MISLINKIISQEVPKDGSRSVGVKNYDLIKTKFYLQTEMLNCRVAYLGIWYTSKHNFHYESSVLNGSEQTITSALRKDSLNQYG